MHTQLESAAGCVTAKALLIVLAHEGHAMHKRTFYRFLRRHDVPCYRIGNTLLIPPLIVFAILGIK